MIEGALEQMGSRESPPEVEDARRFFMELWHDREAGKLDDEQFYGRMYYWVLENLKAYEWMPLPSMPQQVREWRECSPEYQSKMDKDKREKYQYMDHEYYLKARDILSENWSNYLALKRAGLWFKDRNKFDEYKKIRNVGMPLLDRIKKVNREMNLIK